MSIATEISRIKGNIESAYVKAEEKGAMLPAVRNSEGLASMIESIAQSGSGWRPQVDWWDIDGILAEDTEDYEGKMIVLLSDSYVTQIINLFGASKVVLSDGAEYVADGVHRWDVTKDKACGLGYKTRFMIRYYRNRADFEYKDLRLSDALYVIFKGLRMVVLGNRAEVDCPIRGALNVEYIRFEDCDFDGSSGNFCFGFPKLRGIEGYVVQDDVSMEKMYQGTGLGEVSFLPKSPTNMSNAFTNASVEYLPYVDTGRVSNFWQCFNGSRVRVIESLDLNGCTVASGMFMSPCLVSINEIANIKMNEFKFDGCVLLNHDTLVRILNALCDYSSDAEGIHTIVFGATNLAKLSDEELAIGQDKGWTIS